MPLQPSPHALIELPISDKQLADTIIKRKARFVSLTHQQTDEGECLVRVGLLIEQYAAAGGDYGPPLTGPGFSAYLVELSADNLTVVDAATGEILAIRQGENEDDWQAKLASYNQPVMLQGDFFEYLREKQPILIGELIRQHIQQADAMGRFV